MRYLSLLTFALVSLACPGPRPQPTQILQHEPWNSQADPATRPWAIRDGTTITLRPSGATFKVPKDWLEWHDKFGNNFHLTHQQLDAVARGDGDWDTEYASVCNAVLPFDRCAAHVGGEGWGKQGVAWSDLQVRVYDLDEAIEDVERDMEKKGVADVERFSGKVPKMERDAKGDWRRTMLSFDRWYGDYGGTAHVDFRVRRCGDHSFVFVFMYVDIKDTEDDIRCILESFATK
jgi:hypothetical protein